MLVIGLSGSPQSIDACTINCLGKLSIPAMGQALTVNRRPQEGKELANQKVKWAWCLHCSTLFANKTI